MSSARWMLVWITIALVSCSATQPYEGPKQSASETVVIEGTSNLDISAGGYAAKICSVDGRSLSSCMPKIELLPGEHTLTLQTSYMGIGATARTVKQTFEPGQKCMLLIHFIARGSEEPILRCPAKPTMQAKDGQ